MEEINRYIIDSTIEELEENNDFIIDNDEKAEWSIKKIAEDRADAERFINVCQTVICKYQEQIEQAKADLNSKTGYLTHQLRLYMETIKAKETKTQKTYKLPSGTLKVKYQKPEYKRDDAKLTEFLKNNYISYVETTYKPKWADFKKATNFITKDGKAIIEDTGEVVEGVEVIERDPVFEVQT